MNRRVILAVAALLGSISLFAFAQDNQKKAEPSADLKAMMEAYAKLAEPGAEHKLLQPLAGTWDCVVKFWMEPGQPVNESKCVIERKWILGGRFLEEYVKGETFGQPFFGQGWTGYDKTQKKYVSTWVDSMSTGISYSVGTADQDGKTFTFTREDWDPLTSKKVKSRDVLRIMGNDKHVAEMFKEGPDGKELKVMEIISIRKGK